jgi:hypothetical protein
MVHHCVCAAYTGGGSSASAPFIGDKRKPPVASKSEIRCDARYCISFICIHHVVTGCVCLSVSVSVCLSVCLSVCVIYYCTDMVSGFPAQTRNLMGFRGFDCSERNCPVGNLVVCVFIFSASVSIFLASIHHHHPCCCADSNSISDSECCRAMIML